MANKREFSRDEIQDIFRRAAERQKKADRSGGGLTLDELRHIGEESGLDPAHVEAAAREIEQRDVPQATAGLQVSQALSLVERFYGISSTARISQLVPGRMDDETWSDAVEIIESVFQNEGETTEAGPIREWQLASSLAVDYRIFSQASSPGDWLRLFDSMSQPTRGLVTVETHPEGDETRVEMAYTMPSSTLWEGPGLTSLFLAIGLVTIVVFLTVGELPILIAPLVMMVLATGIGLYTRISHRDEILRTRERMEKAMSRIHHLQSSRVSDRTSDDASEATSLGDALDTRKRSSATAESSETDETAPSSSRRTRS